MPGESQLGLSYSPLCNRKIFHKNKKLLECQFTRASNTYMYRKSQATGQPSRRPETKQLGLKKWKQCSNALCTQNSAILDTFDVYSGTGFKP